MDGVGVADIIRTSNKLPRVVSSTHPRLHSQPVRVIETKEVFFFPPISLQASPSLKNIPNSCQPNVLHVPLDRHISSLTSLILMFHLVL